MFEAEDYLKYGEINELSERRKMAVFVGKHGIRAVYPDSQRPLM